MREAIYDDLLPGERGQLHVALAQALERDPELAGQGTSVAAELAFHWYAAHELACALRASVEAGLEADGMYAFAEADRHYERALELWERVPAETDRGIEHAELLSRAAEAAHHGGRDDRAVALIRTLLDELDPADPKPIARALVRLGRYLWVGGRGVESVGVYHRAVEILPPEPSTERAHALAGEAQALVLSDRSREASALCNEALEVARAVGDRRVELKIMNTQIACATFDADVDAAMNWMRSAQAIAGELEQPDELMRAYVTGRDCLDQAGRVEEALNLALDGAERARSIGLERHSGNFLQAEAAARMMCLGRWQEAGELSQAVIDATTAPLALIIAGEVQAVIAALRGDFKHARKLVEESRGTALLAGTSMWIPLQAYPNALLEVAEGRPEQARAAVEDAFAHMGAGEYVFFTRHLYATGARAEADIAERARPLRDDAVVRDCESRAAALVERIDGLLTLYTKFPPPPAAVTARALAAAELSRARGASDPALWQDAANAEDGIGQVHGGAYARFREAEAILGAGGAHAAAAEALAGARAVAERLAMQPLLAEIDALARRARVKLPADGSAPAPPATVDSVAGELGLTDREMEVLGLVAEGLTNKEIGARLFMSDKTASVHVSRILQKLGASNRTEAATSAQRLGLVLGTRD